MLTRIHRVYRRLVPILGAGMLLQANGCTIDTTAIVQGLVTSITNSLISNLVFSSFNLIGP